MFMKFEFARVGDIKRFAASASLIKVFKDLGLPRPRLTSVCTPVKIEFRCGLHFDVFKLLSRTRGLPLGRLTNGFMEDDNDDECIVAVLLSKVGIGAEVILDPSMNEGKAYGSTFARK